MHIHHISIDYNISHLLPLWRSAIALAQSPHGIFAAPPQVSLLLGRVQVGLEVLDPRFELSDFSPLCL